MSHTDTAPAAQTVQLEIQRAMTGEQRLVLAFEMSMFARKLAKARIREEHPDWSDQQVMLEIIRLAFLPAPMPAALRERYGSPSRSICPAGPPPL